MPLPLSAIVVLALIILAGGQSPRSEDNTAADEARGETALEQVEGDLDKDGVSERVVVVQLTPNKANLVESELRIYKRDGDRWSLWHTTRKPFESYPVDEPGGNGFASVSIERGCIVIRHSFQSPHGESGTDHTQRFRFQDGDWYLIGMTDLVHYGCPPYDDDPYSTNIKAEFNFSTGTGVVTTTYAQCDDDPDKLVRLPKRAVLRFSTQEFKGLRMDLHKFLSKKFKPAGLKSREFSF